MDWDRIQDSWKQLRGDVTDQWGKLTDDDVDAIDGSRVFLAGKIQERYGVAGDEAERQVRKWQRQVNDNWLET